MANQNSISQFNLTTKILASFWLLYAVIAIVIVVAQYHSSITVLSVVAYLTVFFALPVGVAYGCWHRKVWSIGLVLILALTQSIRAIQLDTWFNTLSSFAFNPPISLAFAIGDFSSGNGYLVDSLPGALFMLSVLVTRKP
ncbi:hypothetical protein J7384_14005 [Endozoicomonas sp. G2_1]|uniref:hypothetical protein n=1 Tax=Endozoicomonas sp. G2_1 TaxID=2821091 RepID=UPI001ADC3106|nr:hypothetical protein [Endozoicomonas sp. G2_1]MBO9491476.1 hypothetical protein [Endozoicomonas sp. G2_1]